MLLLSLSIELLPPQLHSGSVTLENKWMHLQQLQSKAIYKRMHSVECSSGALTVNSGRVYESQTKSSPRVVEANIQLSPGFVMLGF